jgi:protein Mpv17
MQTLLTAAVMAVLQSMLFTAIVAGPNHMAQNWLEKQWPARTSYAQESSRLPADTGGHLGQRGRLNLQNTAIKFVLDQSLSASLNTVLFLSLFGAIRGRGLRSIQRDVLEAIASL